MVFTDEQPFESSAPSCHAGRPSYPAAAVDHLLEALGVAAGDKVVELGAGTGSFTTLLEQRSVQVAAVEPAESMRSQIDTSALVESFAGTADDTGLPTGCADGVVAATAWHWFDPGPTLAEVRRLLKPGRGLGLIWNEYDESVDWVHQYAAIADSRRPGGSPSSRTGQWRHDFAVVPGWAPLQSADFANPWHTTAEGLLHRLRSSSAISRLKALERTAAESELQTLLVDLGLGAEDTVVLPHRVRVFWSFPTV
ncbi:class I SAM-dependent methyltransferase [Desertihabitans aurantiacus]|uniref:class I SAM-dependent methyltransferase n=1 Tax=Desertihabitans aurantiacus TaxID=2282477 RepID=UPI000DF7B1D4|nr:class I SAM-dependent methyltransferase [Desertihabitans aurantiacus]